MNVLELKSKEEWESLLNELARETRMTVTLTDERGGHILSTEGTRCDLCARIREKPEALTFICSQCNTAMLEEAREVQGPLVDFCDAGLVRMVVPIIRDGRLIGQVTACGGVAKGEEVDSFLVARQVGIPEEEVEALAGTLPVVSVVAIQKMARRSFDRLNP